MPGQSHGMAGFEGGLESLFSSQPRPHGEWRQPSEFVYAMADRLIGVVSKDPDLQALALSIELTRDPETFKEQLKRLKEALTPVMPTAKVRPSTEGELDEVIRVVHDEITGISVLGDLWRDPEVDEICVDAWDRISVERAGRLELTGLRFRSPEHALSVARNLSQKISDRTVSQSNPLVTAQLSQARVQFVYGRLAASGLAIAIRKFRPLMGMDGLLRVGALTEEMRDFLGDCVKARASILVSGGTGTGKTTAINALSEFIPPTERVITIEDAFELQLANTHVVALQSKEKASADDQVVVDQSDLLVAALRMRPDRIIVGEIREPKAAVVMIDAANTGHDGTMTTIHADSPQVAVNERLASLLARSSSGFSDLIARKTVAQAVQLVVHIARVRGRRFVDEVSVVDPSFLGDDGLIRPAAVFKADVLASTGPRPEVRHRRVGSVGADTVLAARLRDAGADRWVEGPERRVDA